MAKIDVNVNQLNSDIQGIKSAIIEANVEVPDGTPTSEYGRLVSEVYEAGAKSEYDRFWDNGQNYGNPSGYQNLFSGAMWNNATFKPKYDIIPPPNATAYMMFRNSGIKGDLVEILKNCNVKLDFSKCYNLQYTFNNTQFTRIGIIDLSSCSYLQSTFQANYALETIDEIILKSNGSQDLSNSFGQCNVLKNIKFSGVIGSNIDFQWSPLSKASIKSVIGALLKTATGKTATFKKSAVDAAFETSEGANDGCVSAEWRETITPYANDLEGNWTILVV